MSKPDSPSGLTRRQLFPATLAAPAVARAARTPGDKPNLLFLWTDEQRADTFAAYSNTRFRTPALNRLGAESVVFDRCYVTQPVCTPSRSSVMTGLWPHQNGCIRNNIPLPRQIPTLPELLAGSAYRTAYMGKWHLGDEVFAQHGFEEWVSIEDGYEQYYSAGRDRATRSSYHHFLISHGYTLEGGRRAFSRDFAVHRPVEHCKPAFLAREASRFILDHRREPWMLYVNFLEPHMPFFGPYNDLHSDEEAPVPANYPGDQVEREPESYRRRRAGFLRDGFGGQDLKTRAGWQRLNRNYAGLCAQVDQAVGRILWALEASGQAANTLIVFTSDHGEMMGAHTMVGKGVMYEESMRVPLLLRAPFRRQRPQRIEGPVSHIDLLPTLLDLLGGKAAPSLPGRSWAPLLDRGGPAAAHCFSQWHTAQGEGDARTVISPEGLKLVIHPNDHCLLFDRRRDPLELNNLYYSPAAQADVARLRKFLDAWIKSTGDRFPAS